MKTLKGVIIAGWPENKGDVPNEALTYWDVRDELSVYNGIVFSGERICIPTKLRTETLKTNHSSHLGIVRCKQRARELVFWPGMNGQIEDMITRCGVCLQHKNKQQKEPMIIQPLPDLPWSKVGADLFELEDTSYLIMVDYYSNFIEVATLNRDTRSSVVIKKMKENIARYGIMDTLITDNGPQFTSAEFNKFVEEYKIDHITSSPLHQQANGLAEKAVQTVKNIFMKCAERGEDAYLSLLEMRNTPRGELGSPSQRLMGRRAKTLMPIVASLIKPKVLEPVKVQSNLLKERLYQKHFYDKNSKVKDCINPGDTVRIYTPEGWKPAELVGKANTPRSHVVKAGDSGRE